MFLSLNTLSFYDRSLKLPVIKGDGHKIISEILYGMF